MTAASPATGPGAAVLAPAGVAIDVVSAATLVTGVANVSVALGHLQAQEMRGNGEGGRGGKDASFPSANNLAKELGVEVRQFHQEIKPAIVRDLSAEARSIGAKNPDIGVNGDGNIVLRNPKTGAQVSH